MSVKEGCFLIGLSLLRIKDASELAAWEANKKRFAYARSFLDHASMDISKALAAGQIYEGDAEEMRSLIEQYDQAVAKGETELIQDKLAELSLKATDLAFQKVVKCECKER